MIDRRRDGATQRITM